jgi:single-stranded-DNA-specific exonuclease
VVGIAASKLVDRFWKPTWLFARKEGLCKGSARSIPGFDVTAAMEAVQELFSAFGGHQAAGGFTFPAEREEAVRTRLITYSLDCQVQQPDLWTSRCMYDCELPADFLSLRLVDLLDDLRPFGHGFEEPRFLISTELLSWTYYNDKSTQKPKHTALTVAGPEGPQKVMCFGQVIEGLEEGVDVQVLVNAQRNFFRGMESLSLIARDLVVGCGAKLV